MFEERAFFHYLLWHLRSKAAPSLEAVGPGSQALPPPIVDAICEKAADPRDVDVAEVLKEWWDLDNPSAWGKSKAKMKAARVIRMECIKLTATSSQYSAAEGANQALNDYYCLDAADDDDCDAAAAAAAAAADDDDDFGLADAMMDCIRELAADG